MKTLIYAMPRSGSTWLANFLTCDGWVFHHDPLGRMTVETVNDLDHVIDTGAYLFRERLTPEREFALMRRVDDSNASLARLGLPQIAEYQDVAVPTFFYERLGDIGYLADLWAQVRGPGFDAERARVLVDWNVQHRLDRVIGER